MQSVTPQSAELVSFKADDGWQLGGTLLVDADASQGAPVVLISGAAAVPHGFYKPIGEYLIRQGAAAVLSYDYRGIGASAEPRKAWRRLRMGDWALRDMTAAIDWLSVAYPTRPLVGLGHSFGGQGIGLTASAHRFSRYATIATMSGYWRGTDEAWRIYLLTQVIGKAFAKLTGHIPGGVGLGDGMPGGVFLDWARWIARPDYFFSDPEIRTQSRFADLTLPFLAIGIEDDPWGTRRAVSDFMQRYENADLRQHWVKPKPGHRIGHFDFFRSRHAEHWSIVSDFLLKEQWPDQAS